MEAVLKANLHQSKNPLSILDEAKQSCMQRFGKHRDALSPSRLARSSVFLISFLNFLSQTNKVVNRAGHRSWVALNRVSLDNIDVPDKRSLPSTLDRCGPTRQ
jgi:hypothetical protein